MRGAGVRGLRLAPHASRDPRGDGGAADRAELELLRWLGPRRIFDGAKLPLWTWQHAFDGILLLAAAFVVWLVRRRLASRRLAAARS